MRKHYNYELPPIDVMEAYEELSPGITQEMVDLAKREQNHQHSISIMNLENKKRVQKEGKTYSIITLIIISIASLLIALFADFYISIIFIASAFISFASISIFLNKNTYIDATSANRSNSKKEEFVRNNRDFTPNTEAYNAENAKDKNQEPSLATEPTFAYEEKNRSRPKMHHIKNNNVQLKKRTITRKKIK
jgi:uncharacterized membrane protein